MAYPINVYHGSYNIQPRTAAVRYIVVHYTGAQTPKLGNAKANCMYFAGGNRNASAHYFIDEGSIFEYANPTTYSTWHVGDGHGKYGITNQNSIGIEVCQMGNNPFSASEILRLRYLVTKLMKQFGVPASRVVRHYDASRKACPYFYTPYGMGGDAAWKKLHATITDDQGEKRPVQIPGEAANNEGLYYRSHVQTVGWLSAVHDGQVSGTTGFSKRLEAFKITPPEGLVLNVEAHIQGLGDVEYSGIQKGQSSGTGSSDNDPIIGTVGKGKRLEGFTISPTKNETGKTLVYRAHLQGTGWTRWYTQGEYCGTRGESRRVEAIQLKLV